MTATPAAPSVSHNRAGDRFHAKNKTELIAELLVLQEDKEVRHACQMADISVGGCAVKVAVAQPEELAVAVLRIRDTSGTIDLEVAGRLCWNQQTSVGSNTFGFRFRRPMDAAVIDQMVSGGYVTRRQETRISDGSLVQIRRAPGETVAEHATLEDFSATGVRIHVDQQIHAGERLLITTESGASGSVFAKWIVKHDNRFECGCVFQNLNSAHAINDALAAS